MINLKAYILFSIPDDMQFSKRGFLLTKHYKIVVKKHLNARLALSVICLFLFFLYNPVHTFSQNFGEIDTDRLLNAEKEPGEWMDVHRNYKEHHHSPLEKIHTNNIDQLGFAWEYDASSRRGQTPRGLEATPIVIDGVMYTSGAWGVVYAINARTGEEIWRYDPDVDGSYARKACCDVVNRGVEVWKGKVYVGTLDGYLVALDAKTGKVLWKVDTFTDRNRSYTITSAPQIAGEKVVIGNSGGEYGVRGYITAYDAESGDFAWRFYTVPGDPEDGFEHPEMKMAAKTWDPDSYWEAGGGGTVWGDMAYDPKLDLLYVGTGNASPYPIKFRSPDGGDNLFLASILAINPETGRLEWYYQTTPGEQWDYTATQHMILANLKINGEKRKVLMQAPKNGFFYLLDRKTGEFISAEPYVKVTWASNIKPSGRVVLSEQGDYSTEPKVVYPSMVGGHNWQPMAFNPGTGLVYIPAINLPMLYTARDSFTYRPGRDNRGAYGQIPPFPDDVKQQINNKEKPISWKEELLAWDPVQQKEVWSVNLASSYNGGVLSTAGNLVFQGTASGHLVAYNAKTGEKLKQIKVGTGIMAAPMTYTIDGQQHIAVMAGYGGAMLNPYPEGSAARKYQNYGRILAFKLGGKSTPLPPKNKIPKGIPKPPDINYTPQKVQKGEKLYYTHCARCHSAVEQDNHSGYPSMALLTRRQHKVFKEIVLNGIMSYGGMAGYADVLTEEEAEAIQAYIVKLQKEIRQEK